MQMLRRIFIQNTLYLSAALAAEKAMTATQPGEHIPPSAENLKSTALIQANHPRIVTLANEITRDAGHERMAAVQIHDWVRDQILFGIPPAFYETSATESLDVKLGYCNTKISLFNALLRAKAIPTRIRVVDLSAQVLHGLFDPGTPYVDHALTEVFLDERWIKVDSYVVDKSLVVAATKKLASSTRQAGFGIHLAGSPDWDGRKNNFIQYMDDQSIPNYVLTDHGVFVDVADFYQKTQVARNRKTLLTGLGIRFGSMSINQQIQRIRNGNEAR
jgi:transglutaminase-like putative cysteine protease